MRPEDWLSKSIIHFHTQALRQSQLLVNVVDSIGGRNTSLKSKCNSFKG